MSRLDRHVAAVRRVMALNTYFHALGWAGLAFGGVVWLAILADRLFAMGMPRAGVWFWAGLIAVAVGAMAYAVLRRPSRHHAAVAIDQKLGLKEKISTALYARPIDDPFAIAAVRDAERTAEQVRLNRQFRPAFPHVAYGTIAVALLALLTGWLLNPMDLFGREERRIEQAMEEQRIKQAQKTVEDAIAQVYAIPSTMADDEAIHLARQELQALLDRPISDPAQTQRSALKALQDVNEALRQQVRESQKFATAQNMSRMFSSMQPQSDERGPVADAQRAIAKGDFAEAAGQLQQAVEKFEQMDEQQQQQAAQQMQQMAQQLQQMAQDPRMQQQLQQQLQQMGANQQQAQEMAQAMQQAAAGDQQAQQQLQEMAQKAMQQMNDGRGPTQQQQQQIQQMMQQMQAQTNNQAQAQAMAQAAEQMAQAMQQQAQQGGQPQAAEQMAQGQAAMQQQLQQLQAMQQDMAQIGAAQAAAQRAAADAAAGLDGAAAGGQGDEGGQEPAGQWGGIGGEWAEGNPDHGGEQAGPGGVGIGAGERGSAFAPGGFQQEVAPSQDIEEGRILASYFVNAGSVKGEARVELSQAAESALREATDEVDQQRVSRQAQRAVRDYFQSMERETE